MLDLRLKKLAEKKWYNGAVVACIGVAFYVLLTNFSTIYAAVGGFLGSFRAVFLGMVFAYILNPVARFFSQKVFGPVKNAQTRWCVSVVMAIVSALLALVILLGMLIPQLIQSVVVLSENIDGYASSLIAWLEGSGLLRLVSSDGIETLSENALDSISSFVQQNASMLLSAAANSGKGVITTVIALILAVYFLIDKKRVMMAWWRLVRALFSIETTEGIMDLSLRCDVILMNYLGRSLLDALIIGAANAVFMLACGMQYVWLLTVVVAVTNLVPTFGPVIGAVIGGFVLVLVNPVHALLFIAFSVVIQFVDAYILKPKLFSDSLGVPGLLILTACIVLGNLFGVVGMLLAIPAAAIVSFLYNDYFLPRQEKRRAQEEAERNASAAAEK